MKLTAKQERFCQAIADGMTQADAYRAAYNAGAMKPETVQSKASVLMKSGGMVAARVDQLRKAMTAKQIWTREKSVIALADIAGALDSRANEKVSAIKELNAMHGFNAPVKIDVRGEISVIERRIVKA